MSDVHLDHTPSDSHSVLHEERGTRAYTVISQLPTNPPSASERVLVGSVWPCLVLTVGIDGVLVLGKSDRPHSALRF